MGDLVLSARPENPRVTDCTRCEAYLLATPSLVDAVADVLSAFDLTFTEVLRSYLDRFHSAGHRLVDSP
jgi:hypothetical protein